MESYRTRRALILTLFIAMIMVISPVFAIVNDSGGQHSAGANTADGSASFPNNTIVSQLDHEHFTPVLAAPDSVVKGISPAYKGTVTAMVTFSLSNQSRLSSLLSNLSNPNSEVYHKFLTRSEFAANFSISPEVYSQAVSYFSQYPAISVTTYADRLSIGITGTATEIGNLFNTTIATNGSDSTRYFAESVPEMPATLAPMVSQVTGLSNAPFPGNYNLASKAILASKGSIKSSGGGYPAPVYNSGFQYIYGSDLQVAYDEQSLLNITYPTNEVIATILWSGTNSSGNPVGAFDPSDIYAYYNATLPSYEPHAKVFGVPLNGAVKPGLSASYDVTGASEENTLDLEMAGSTAPGASIYNVYGPNSTNESIDSAFAFILNPNSTYKALDNVSVITNSWGGTDMNSTVWYGYLQEAQARGISVLASSGDSGDNTASSKYVGSTVEVPSAMAYDNFGVTAVGGDTLTLQNNLHIKNETAWYISSSDTSDGGPVGSTGGISSVFKEPLWQIDSEANNLINGQGRGVPDISAIANNTIVYITVNGIEYYGNPYFYIFWGTSVASPVEAGIVAEIDAVLNYYNQSNLGYLNPLIYSLANKQVAHTATTSDTGYIETGRYNSTLPALPFYNVMYGRNHVYDAAYGYNLVTGWGSIDAYNMSMYVLNINRSMSHNGLKGVEDKLILNNLNVTSYLYNSTTGTYSDVNTFYNASIQQNLFIANQFGAPLYWIQNVVYINGSQSMGWVVNYTGWAVYPFYGQYPYQTVYEYNFPLGKTITMPHTFNAKTWITNLTEPMQQTVNFQINSHTVSLPVPGAAYIIDAYNYSYEWQGHTYYNGPYPDNPYYGGLNPQFGLVGGPSLGLGIFGKQTTGSVSAYIEPLDMNGYIPAITKVFNVSIDQTGEQSEFLNFTNVNASSWTISVNSTSQLQGIVDYISPQYSQIFQENGLPSGTTWSIDIGGNEYSTASREIIVPLVNGSYTAQIGSPAGYFASPSNYIFTVDGYESNFQVMYVNSGNETYMNPTATIYPLNDQVFKGDVLNTTYFGQGTLSFGMAYDNTTGMLFIPVLGAYTGSGGVYVYNTVTGKFIKTIPTLSYDAVYNSNTGYVYAMSITGNVSEIDPSTFTIVKNISLPESVFNITLLHEQGNYVYALSENGNISQIDASTMTITKTIRIGSGVSPLFTVYGENAYAANTSGNYMAIVNFTTYAINEVNLPLGYGAYSVVRYFGSELLIGGQSYSYELYNVSTGLLSVGPAIPDLATSSTYNLVSHLVYIFSASYALGSLGNITVVNPSNDRIISRIAGVILQTTPAFYSTGQNIYADNYNGSISEYFVPLFYTVTFSEIGLPSGTAWYVNITGQQTSGPITQSSYSVSLINGTYTYSISTANKDYAPNVYSGSFPVSGSPASVPEITFSLETYTLTFTESGLQSGTWYVNLSNGDQGSAAAGSPITFSLPNDTYSYTTSTSNKLYHPSSYTGTVDVIGSTPVSIVFVQTTYSVQFTESGLPAGTEWYVNLTNDTGYVFHGYSTSSTIVFSLVNGTYTLENSTADKIYAPSSYSGTLTVSGSSVTLPIVTFSPVKYTVTFSESGLPSGTTWYVNLSNGQSFSSTSDTISFSETNGSYSYTVATSNKIYSPSPYSSSFQVNGNSVPESITFSEVKYTVTFTENGLPAGKSWSVTFGDSTQSSAADTITFSVINGTYSYTIGNVSGYTAILSGNISVNGQNLNKAVSFSSSPAPGKTSSTVLSETELYGIIGAAVVIAAIVSVIVWRRKNK